MKVVLLALMVLASTIATGCSMHTKKVTVPVPDFQYESGSGTVPDGPDATVTPDEPTAGAIVAPANAAGSAVTPPDYRFDGELVDLRDAFKRDVDLHGQQLVGDDLRIMAFIDEVPATIKTLTSDTLGYCIHHVSWTEIYIVNPAKSAISAIEPEYTEEAKSFNLRRIVYHELTHCLLNKDHAKTGEWTTGIMYPVYTPVEEHEATWVSLVDQLFSPDYFNALPNTPESAR